MGACGLQTFQIEDPPSSAKDARNASPGLKACEQLSAKMSDLMNQGSHTPEMDLGGGKSSKDERVDHSLAAPGKSRGIRSVPAPFISLPPGWRCLDSAVRPERPIATALHRACNGAGRASCGRSTAHNEGGTQPEQNFRISPAPDGHFAVREAEEHWCNARPAGKAATMNVSLDMQAVGMPGWLRISSRRRRAFAEMEAAA